MSGVGRRAGCCASIRSESVLWWRLATSGRKLATFSDGRNLLGPTGHKCWKNLTKCSSGLPSHQHALTTAVARQPLNMALGLDGWSRIVLDEEQGAEYLAAFSRGLVRWVR